MPIFPSPRPLLHVAALLLALLISSRAEVRLWTNLQGESIQGELNTASADSCTLIVNGQNYQFPLAELSAADQDFVRQWLAAQPATIPDAQTPTTPITTSLAEPYGPGKMSFPEGVARTQLLEADLPTSFRQLSEFEVEIVEENEETDLYTYASEHFRFSAERRLSGGVIEGLAEMFETTYLAVQDMPWGIPIPPPPTADNRVEVGLYLDEENYIRDGGPPGSAGVAIGGVRFLCLLQFVGVRDTGRRLVLESLENSLTLTHELTHIFRSVGDHPMPIWAVEGFALHMETFPYNSRGTYEISNNLELACDGVSQIHFPVSLEEFLIEPRSAFYDGGGGEDAGLGEDSHQHYAAAKVLMTYFWHADQPKDEEKIGQPIRAYLRAIYSGTPVEEARTHLLAGRSYEELQEDIQAAYRRHAEITFPTIEKEEDEDSEEEKDSEEEDETPRGE